MEVCITNSLFVSFICSALSMFVTYLIYRKLK